jgi:hypothetical protein
LDSIKDLNTINLKNQKYLIKENLNINDKLKQFLLKKNNKTNYEN